jgi:hypothetical protein
MIQKITFLFSALLLFGFSKAQVSKESYEKAVDYLNCKTVELSLKDDKNLFNFKDKCPCSKSNYLEINQFLRSVKLDATIALSNEIESLKNLFQEDWKKDDIVNYLTNDIFNDKLKYNKISAFVEKRKSKPIEFEIYKNNLLKDLNEHFDENVQEGNFYQSNHAKQHSNYVVTSLELKDKEYFNSDRSWFNGINSQMLIVSLFVSLILIALTIYFLNKYFYGENSKIPESFKKYIDSSFDCKIHDFKSSLKNLSISDIINIKNTINDFDLKLKDANIRIRDLEFQIENIKSLKNDSNPPSSLNVQSDFQEKKQPELVKETFFLSSPNSNGSFDESSSSSFYKEGATIYRFTKLMNNKANFQIDEREASIKLALQYRDKRIDPVCETINAFNQAKKIINIQNGEAELLNGRWIVNKKAKIKYEN